MIKKGNKAPAFTLKNQDGEKVSLKDFKGKKVVLYFYPKDNTSGCTKEAESFKKDLRKFKNQDAVILGVSGDSVESHKKFSEKLKLPFDILADPDRKVLEKYDVLKEKKRAGKTYKGIERTTVVIDEDGRVQEIYNKVKVDGHSKDVLQTIKELD